ncbi:DNA excision repair protein ERCC-6-like 2 [Acropora cervicornis]|uniref:DNA excision repair protein ERCC-6-like 2 n=1 Tax=Acropora cervicornis TaxID=6130 RepID=A0AAD9QZD2_ACRCE|nr:DNA excision repair protein ERCC-6-like 2 [Acropora cervicornis]
MRSLAMSKTKTKDKDVVVRKEQNIELKKGISVYEESCGVRYTHVNRHVVGPSKAEDHMSKQALKDMFELRLFSQQPANCLPALEVFTSPVQQVDKRVWFVFALQLISGLLMFQPAKCLICKEANWYASLDKAMWSTCPRNNTYLRGLWRSPRKAGDERVGRIELGKCCEASYLANRPATCSNANWQQILDRFNVWALCPTGYYLNGLRVSRAIPGYLNDIDEAQCCHPQNHPNSYEHCYDEDVSRSFDDMGWSECQQPGYYMTGFYKSSCNDIYCIEKFRCCKMKKHYLEQDSWPFRMFQQEGAGDKRGPLKRDEENFTKE